MPRVVVPVAAAAAVLLALAAPGRAAEKPCLTAEVQKSVAAAAVVPCDSPVAPCLPAERPCQN